jgi:hypothetical protein
MILGIEAIKTGEPPGTPENTAPTAASTISCNFTTYDTICVPPKPSSSLPGPEPINLKIMPHLNAFQLHPPRLNQSPDHPGPARTDPLHAQYSKTSVLRYPKD